MPTKRKVIRGAQKSTPADHLPEKEARERILDAAEAIFAEHGAKALSMRAITSQAGMNVAGVHFYFGSKQGLILELVRRRFEPINTRRIELLDQAFKVASPEMPVLEAIVDAFLEPLLRIGESVSANRAETIRRFIGRVVFLPPEFSHEVVGELFRPVIDRFQKALIGALPHLDACEIMWRMHLAAGPVTRVLVQGHILPQMSGGTCPDEPIEQLQARVRSFICAALRAPAIPVTKTPEGASNVTKLSASNQAAAV